MEKENEVIENLFDEADQVVGENISVDLPPVAPVNNEEPVVDNPFGVPLMSEQSQIQSQEEMKEEKVEENLFSVSLIDEQPQIQSQEEIKEEKVEEPQEESVDDVNHDNLNKEVLEHPDAKIILNNEHEEEVDKKELEELKNVKLMDNSSLRFVLILGAILLVVVFLIPIISEYI